jgi:competence protein ComEC
MHYNTTMDGKLFSFIAGAFSSLLWTSLPSMPAIFILLILLTLFAKLNQHITFLLLGVVWMASVGHWQYSLQLSSEQTSQPVHIIGEVQSLVTRPTGDHKQTSQQINQQNIRFNIKVNMLNNSNLLFSKTFRLSWREPDWPIYQGQIVKLLVKVKPPHGLANEAGFNYQQWLFSEGIVATGYVKTDSENQLLTNHLSFRQNLLNRFLTYDLNNQSWLAALTFGYRGLLQPSDWQLVQKTGVAHLIAISGLHLALVASLSYVLIAWIGGLLVSRFHRLHSINLRHLAMLLTIFSTLAYSGLAGFGLPTLRAWLMLLLFSVFFLLNIQVGTKSLILLGLSCFVMLFPLSIFGMSFWLSFSAVIIICFVFWRWPEKHAGFSFTSLVKGMVKLQLCLTVLMLPLVAWQFSYVSTVSPLVNLLAVPFVTFALVPICLTGVMAMLVAPDWAEFLFSAADRLMDYGLVFLQTSLTPSWAHFTLPAIPALAWLTMFLFVLGCCLPTFWLDKRYLGLLLLPLLSHAFPSRNHDWKIDILDVGQGVAVLISKNNRVLIYDVGARYPSGFNMANSVILPILQARGLSLVDIVFISHGDNDHAGSLTPLLKSIKVTQVLSNQDSCKQGLNIQWQGLKVEGFWPDDANLHNDNNGSCVLKVSDNYHSAILPGDIDKSIEAKLVNLNPQALQADILLAAHHGSNTSSSSALIQAVKPKYVVFSQGFMNRWQFPRNEVIDRFRQVNQPPKLFSTSDTGQVSFVIEYNNIAPIKVLTQRQDIYPYWYANF